MSVQAPRWQQQWRLIFEQIEREALHLDPVKAAVTVVSAPLFVIGFALALVLRVAWLVIAFAWSAAEVGWRNAGPIRGPKVQEPYR